MTDLHPLAEHSINNLEVLDLLSHQVEANANQILNFLVRCGVTLSKLQECIDIPERETGSLGRTHEEKLRQRGFTVNAVVAFAST